LHCWFYKDSSPTDFAAFAPFARQKFNRPLPRSSTPNCHWPVLAHGHQLGLCRGARPSRWPFPASRRGRDGALRRPPARAFLSPAGRQKFRWPKTGKRQRGQRRGMSLPKRQRTGALQDAPRIRWSSANAPAFWSAVALHRFSIAHATRPQIQTRCPPQFHPRLSFCGTLLGHFGIILRHFRFYPAKIV